MTIEEQLKIITAILPLRPTLDRDAGMDTAIELRFTEGPAQPCWCLRWERDSKHLEWWDFDLSRLELRVIRHPHPTDVIECLFKSLNSLRKAEKWPSAITLAVWKERLRQQLGEESEDRK